MQFKLKNIIFIFLISFVYSYESIDSSLILNYNIDNRAILIPNYGKNFLDFKNEFLGKNKKFFIDINFSYIDDNCSNIQISPSFRYRKLQFKLNLDYLINNQSSLYDNKWDTTFDLLEKIEYFHLNIFDDRLNLSLGEISDLSFGHGYLLNDYGNNYNNPIKRNLGFSFNLRNSNNSVMYQFFISSLEETINEGGLIGQHFSFLVSNSFPLRVGFGHLIDLNQLIDYNAATTKRQVNGFEIDFDLPIITQNLFFIGEITGIRFPDRRYYKRIDDSQFTNDKKSRDGTWGIAFPGIQYMTKNYDFKITLNYNSAVHSPYYFNRTYDFEKIRYRSYNIQNESFYPDEEDLLMSFVDENSDGNFFLPKDIYGMITDDENTYPTYGFSSSLDLKIGSYSKIMMNYSYFTEIDNAIDNLSFHTVSIDLRGQYNILSIFTEFDIFLSKNFIESSEFLNSEENTIYGAKVDFNIYKKISIFGEWKETFYDVDLNGSLDRIPYINMGLKLKY